MNIREAKIEDLCAIVSLLATDKLGQKREDISDLKPYKKAFYEIKKDPYNHLLVAVSANLIVGTIQLTFIRNMTFRGSLRAQIEGVRTHADYRGQGIGRALIQYAINLAKDQNCHLVQLTSSKQRHEALSFYERLGFEKTHEGFKLYLF